MSLKFSLQSSKRFMSINAFFTASDERLNVFNIVRMLFQRVFTSNSSCNSCPIVETLCACKIPFNFGEFLNNFTISRVRLMHSPIPVFNSNELSVSNGSKSSSSSSGNEKSLFSVFSSTSSVFSVFSVLFFSINL